MGKPKKKKLAGAKKKAGKTSKKTAAKSTKSKCCAEETTLEVTLLEARSGKPIKEATVKIAGPSKKAGKTDKSGVVRFTSIDPGDYTITIIEDEIDNEPDEKTASVAECKTTALEMKVKRKLRTVTMKRKHIALKGEDQFGHWWTEIAAFEGQSMSSQESYGWWPDKPFSGGNVKMLYKVVTGVPGDLNGKNFGGSSTQDAHHGDSAEEEFNPYIRSGDTPAEVKTKLRAFAKEYSGQWSWPFGQNCHSFQEALMDAGKLTRD